MYFVFLNNY